MKNRKFQYGIQILLPVLLLAFSYWLLDSAFFTFMTWWELLWLLGVVFMPIASRIFSKFDDKGWQYSKVLAVALCSYIQWMLTSLKIIPFTTQSCIIVTGLSCIIICSYRVKSKNKSCEIFPWKHIALVYREEILFFVIFLFWTYLAGFHPAAHGTEKYMDFGFMKSMMRSTTLPAQDMWYAGKNSIITMVVNTLLCFLQN